MKKSTILLKNIFIKLNEIQILMKFPENNGNQNLLKIKL